MSNGPNLLVGQGMKRIQKLQFIIFLIAFTAIYFFTYGNDLVHRQFTYQLVIDQYELSGNQQLLEPQKNIVGLWRKSPLYITQARILHNITGTRVGWRIAPGAIVFGLGLYAFLRSIPVHIRLVAIFASIAGPLAAISYTFTLQRTYTTTLLMITYVLIIKYNIHRNSELSLAVVTFLTSLVIWLTHYTFWIFFMVFVIVFQLHPLDTDNKKLTIPASVIPVLIAPFTLWTGAARPYASILPALQYKLRTASINNFDWLLHFRSDEVTGLGGLAVNGAAPPSPEYLGEVVYTLYFVSLAILVLGWAVTLFVSHRASDSPFYLSLHKFTTNDVLLTAASVSFVITGLIYIFIGYYSRVFTLWPVIIPIFTLSIWERLHDIRSLGDNRRCIRPFTRKNRGSIAVTLFLLSLVLISAIHVVPVFYPEYTSAEQRAGIPNTEQLSSSSFATYASADTKIITDMLHSSMILIETDHRRVDFGSGVRLPGGKYSLDHEASALFDPTFAENTHVIVTTTGTTGLPIGQATVQLPNTTRHEIMCLKIYDNGVDKWYAECTDISGSD